MEDPNPLVSGRGIAMLRQAGVEVEVGVMAEKARLINLPFIKYITTGKPLVAAKMAVSLDGKIATRTGSSQWITGEKARQRGRYLRHRYDAILVGINTVLADNPRLTVRLPGRETINPLRVILDSRLRIPLDSHLLDVNDAPTLVVTTDASDAAKRKYLADQGVNLLVQDGNTSINLNELLTELGQRQITGLLVEGGAAVHGSFFDQDLVDLLYLFMGYKIIGGKDAPGPIAGLGVAAVEQAKAFDLLKMDRYPQDLGLLLERRHSCLQD